MKLHVAMVLLAITSPAFGQAQSSGAATVPGCGAANIEFNVKTDDKQRPAVQPDAAKAHVYSFRTTRHFFRGPDRRLVLGSMARGWARPTATRISTLRSIPE